MAKKHKSPRTRKISLDILDTQLILGKCYAFFHGGRKVFGSLRKKLSENSVLLQGFDRVKRVVEVFHNSSVISIDRQRGKHAKK